MNLHNLNQQEINEQFLLACEKGDVHVLRKLYHSYEPHLTSFSNIYIRKMHQAFLQIFFSQQSFLNIHINNDMGLRTACKNGHTEVVRILISLTKNELQSSFDKYSSLKQFNRSFTDCLDISLSKNYTDISNLLLPLTDKDSYFSLVMQHNFLAACLEGKINVVKYMLTNPFLKEYKDSWINGEKTEFTDCNQGFIYACENNHLNIVKYLASSSDLSEHVDINLIEQKIRIKSIDVLDYLIAQFKLHKDHSFISKIDFYSESKLNNMLPEESYLNKKYKFG